MVTLMNIKQELKKFGRNMKGSANHREGWEKYYKKKVKKW